MDCHGVCLQLKQFRPCSVRSSACFATISTRTVQTLDQLLIKLQGEVDSGVVANRSLTARVEISDDTRYVIQQRQILRVLPLL